MEISNNHKTPAFSGIRVNTSKMNQVQKNLSNKIADILSYSDEYQKASNCGIDVYFLPTANESSVKVAFMDTFSDNFYRKSPNRLVQNTIITKKNRFTLVDNIIGNLKRILAGEFKSPEFDAYKIAEGDTDLGKLRPELKNKLKKYSEELSKFMDPDEIPEILAKSHININQNQRNEGKILSGDF